MLHHFCFPQGTAQGSDECILTIAKRSFISVFYVKIILLNVKCVLTQGFFYIILMR